MPGQGQEVQVAARWLASVLRGDASLAALAQARPAAGAALETNIRLNNLLGLPGVVYSFQGGSDLRAVGPIRVWSSQLWLVKAVTPGEALGPPSAIAARVDELLDGWAGPVTGGGRIAGCIRESPSYERQVQGDQVFQHLGGEYRIFAQNP